MSPPNPTQRVQEIYAAFGRGDINFILNALAPEVTWIVQGPASVPLYGSRRGRDQVLQFFQAIGQHLQIQQFEPREFIAQGDKVVVLGAEKGVVTATGRSWGGEWVHIFTFRNGQIVDFREFTDTASLASAFTAASRSAA